MQVIFTIPACKTMECLVKEWSMGAFLKSDTAWHGESGECGACVEKGGLPWKRTGDPWDNQFCITTNNGSYWIRFTNGTLTAIERMPQDQVP